MEFVPKLSESITIDRIEDSSYFYIVYDSIQQKQFKINRFTKELIDSIDNIKTIEEIAEYLKKENPNNINANTELLIEAIDELQLLGIVESNKVLKNKIKYIWLPFTLIPQSIVIKISSIFTFLFFKNIYPLLLICITFLTAIMLLFLTKSDIYSFITPMNILFYIPLIYLSKILHEFGHASAIKHYGLTPGSIGFGFYLLSPVFYADVSLCWKLKPSKRIIINIAGMYFQLLLCLLLVMVFLITSNTWFLVSSFFILMSIIPNVNPFIRYDGYWILTDLLNVSNLKGKALKTLKSTLGWLFSSKNKSFPLQHGLDYFLFFYSIFNRIMIACFIVFAMFYGKSSLVEFPNKIGLYYISIRDCNGCSILTLSKNFVFDNFFTIIIYLFAVSFITLQIRKVIKKFISVRKI